MAIKIAKKPSKLEKQKALLTGATPLRKPAVKVDPSSLPVMIKEAARKLSAATNAAEVLDARDAASLAYGVAKSVGRLQRAKGAHDEIVAATHRAQADALEIEAKAKRRLADEYDAAQQTGEVAKGRPKSLPDGNTSATAADVGLSSKEVMEAREVRDVLANDPDAVGRALKEIMASGDEPSRAALKRQIAPMVKEIRRETQAAKKERRAEREVALASEILNAPSMTSAWQPRTSQDALFVGKAGEHIVCADLLMQGYNCSLASQGSPYDIVVERDAKLFRIQVKTCHVPRNINMAGRNERDAYSWRIRDTKESVDRADIVACVALDIPIVAYFAHADCPATIQLDSPGVLPLKKRRTFDRTVDMWPFGEAFEKALAANAYVDFCKVFPEFPRRKFGVIYADPPWRYEPFSRETGMDRAADNHYPTVDTTLWASIGPYVPAADDCALFLWATVPMLQDALYVMKRWGFEYKSNAVWVKDRAGTGYWFRNQHELLLIGTRGNIPAPAMGEQWDSVIEAPLGEHSAKPEKALEMIEAYYPHVPKIELNRRGPARLGWSSWGQEAEDAA